MSWIRKALRYADIGTILAFLGFVMAILCACGIVYGHIQGWWVN